MTTAASITLRAFHEDDAEFFAVMASDERVTRFIGDGKPWSARTIQTRVQQALEQDALEVEGSSRWFLATEATVPVGIVVSTRKVDGVEIGYWVSPDAWGRGIAGAMLGQALTLIPEAYVTEKLIARVDPANAASARLLTKRGFQLEANREGLDQYALIVKPD